MKTTTLKRQATAGKKAITPMEREHALHLLRSMIRIRCLEAKCAELYSAMKIRGFLHLFVCENNLYAMGTAIRYSHSVTDLARKAASHDMAAMAVDGMDVAAVEGAAKEASSFVRAGKCPYFLECRTYIFAHIVLDPRSLEAWTDPIRITTKA